MSRSGNETAWAKASYRRIKQTDSSICKSGIEQAKCYLYTACLYGEQRRVSQFSCHPLFGANSKSFRFSIPISQLTHTHTPRAVNCLSILLVHYQSQYTCALCIRRGLPIHTVHPSTRLAHTPPHSNIQLKISPSCLRFVLLCARRIEGERYSCAAYQRTQFRNIKLDLIALRRSFINIDFPVPELSVLRIPEHR